MAKNLDNNHIIYCIQNQNSYIYKNMGIMFSLASITRNPFNDVIINC